MRVILPLIVAIVLSPVMASAQEWDTDAQGGGGSDQWIPVPTGQAGAGAAAAVPFPATPRAVVRSGPVVAQLASEPGTLRPGQAITVAVVLDMDPQWHTYWSYPGESGLPTTVQWDLPAGFTAGPLRWPVPERFVSQDLVTYGYSGRVLLLTDITAPTALQGNRPAVLRARVSWLACRVECTPGSASLTISIPTGAAAAGASRLAAEIADSRSRLPATLPSGARISAAGDAAGLTLQASGLSLPQGARALFYPDGPNMVKVSAAQGFSRDGESGLRITLQRERGAPARLTGLLVTTGAGTPRAFEVATTVLPAREGGWGLLAALALAFVGGLILNLMPCVLPVISLKALAVLRQDSHRARKGLLFTLGVLVSFWIIAGVLEGLRAGGHLLGWGFQFQDPAVVVVTAVLFFLIGLNLFGVFEVGSVAARWSGRLQGGGGSFATGVFATAVATPCTAPFMGAAVGYALSHSTVESLGVFTVLGLGMAAPSLVLYAVPRLGSFLPRPGRWMETFRQVMGFPMMAAAVWMASVLASLSGADGAILLLAALLAAGVGAWIWGRWGTLTQSRAARVVAGVLAVVLAVGSTVLVAEAVPRATGTVPAQAASSRIGTWEPWSAGRVEELRRAGTPVLVDFSAQWCLTCLVNERVALGAPSVRSALREAGVATLRADWTDTNAEIAHALGAFGRASVPLYVFYPRGGKDPQILPEILTPGIVLAAIR